MNLHAASTVFFMLVSGTASAFEPSDHIQLSMCQGAGAESLMECFQEQVNACKAAAEAEDFGYFGTRICDDLAFEQADLMLNEFYRVALAKTKVLEKELAGSPFTGQEELLRSSQRSWISVRDATCELNVSYGAIGSGSDSVVSGCMARLTVQRVADLQTEIGHYLD